MEDVKSLITEVQTILQSHSQKSERLDLVEQAHGQASGLPGNGQTLPGIDLEHLERDPEE